MAAGSSARTWTNWARTVTFTPARTAAPLDESELAAAVADAAAEGLRVRAVGAGHSFTPAAATDGLLLTLDHLSGIERIERDAATGNTLVTVGAGTRLHALNRLLDARGLALWNLGDIDRQSVAGAISTGTHGTGARFGGLATQVRGVRVVGPDGTVRDVSARSEDQRDRDLFEASRLGLGATGILSAVTLEVAPAYDLRAQEEPWPLDRVLAELDDLVADHDHFELYWFPLTRRALTLRNTRLPRDPADLPGASGEDPRPRRGLRDVAQAASRVRTFVDEEVLSNGAFALVNEVATNFPRSTPRLNDLSARVLSARTYTAPSHEVFCSRRRVRFREMEYALPRAALLGVLAELDAWLRETGENVPFPVEVRFAAADDVWLSTAHGRDTAYVAVHQYWRLPFGRYFTAAERILTAAGGRPHWGKLHTRTAADLAPLYPRFGDFGRVRAAADPDGVFSNAYTDRVLGSRTT
ncbi:D-arabinono-1,4-lactone oxidase [Antribacter gilvus]|uniref:D-arabinono-1,4-lactone oxidase n=1 Tax=Antribacter gilvus TaxID=2304675 RepID=UPI000F78F4C1|nr:D-arabinono-1,4-lactone oxidase [Antribacter gilvus]